MTFAEYNTDENFDKKESSLDELVKLGLAEGKTSDEIKSSLSPKWQKSKKIGEFDNYVKQYSKPKEEEKPVKEEVIEKETKETAPKINAPTLDGGEEKYINDQKKRADKAEADALNKIDSQSEDNWKKEYDTYSKMSEAYKRIDDKMVEQLPTFLFKRFSNGEFGDPKSSDAKLRLTHFLLNGVQSKLKNASNAAMIAAGKSPLYQDTMSDYEKYQQSNLAKGMENRWKKYEAETQTAIDLATKEGMKEQDARLAVEQLTRDKNINTVWNMMDSNQKLYAMEVTKKIGDYLGKMDISELGDFIAGAAYEGTMDKDKVVALGLAKLVEKSPELIEKIKDGEMKDMVLSLLPSLGAGVGGAGGKTNSNGDQTNLTGNLQNYESIDGSSISFDFSDPKANDKIKGELEKLKIKYINGEIDGETFRKYYDPLYAEGKKHFGSIFTTPSSDKVIHTADAEVLTTLDEEFSNLNKQAKDGDLSPSAYQKKVDALIAKAEKHGASKEQLEYIKKKTVSSEKILKAVEKKSKKK